MRVLIATVALAALATASFAAYPHAKHWVAQDLGLLVGGQVPPDRDRLEAWLAWRTRAFGARQVSLVVPGGAYSASFSDLGLSLDVAGTRERVLERAGRPTLIARIHRQLAPTPDLEDVPLVVRCDVEQARRELSRLEPAVKTDPVDARLDLARHARIDDVAGRELDVESSIFELTRSAPEDGFVLPVVTRQIPAHVTSAALEAVDVSRVLSSYETDFTHHAGPRAINIATAARYLNGAVIGAGEVFSFNQTVGPRTVPRGFTFAPVIVADELEPGVGGGVCQVASTLHAAAVFGGFDVVQRRSHSRPSGYTPLGLDATVIDGEMDLKLRNPYDSPVIIHAFLPTHTSLRVELLGRDAPGKVEHFFEVKDKHPFVRRVVIEPGFEPNQNKRHQKGSWGYDVLSTVRTTYPDGQRRYRFYTSTYSPVPEVYWVGAGSDVGLLPALPEGGVGVETEAPSGPSNAL